MPRAKKVLTIEERIDKIGELLESIAKEARIWRHVKQQAVEPQGVTVPAAPKTLRKKVVKTDFLQNPKTLPDVDGGKEET